MAAQLFAATALLPLPARAQSPAPSVAAAPSRIVSLNVCTDELVLRLVPPARVASVTWLARDPDSNVADLAAKVAINHGLAEEIVPQNPDLVIAGAFTTRAAVALLKQLHLPLAEIGIPKDFAEIRRDIREVARLVGESDRGEQLVARMDARLAAIPPVVGARPRAMVLNANGVTVGRGTLVGEIMHLAGMENVAATLGIEYGLVSLETAVINQVDILIVSTARDGPPAIATEILRHPVLAKLADRVKIVSVPGRLWNCGGPEAVAAVEYLRGVVDDFRREHANQ